MTYVCMYFQVHQPVRLRDYRVFDIGRNHDYFDDKRNEFYLKRISQKCYLPANQKLLDIIERTGGDFRASFSITGVLMDELERKFPDVLDSFRRLADTGCVEIFGETYYHSLAFLISRREFREQVRMHTRKIRDVFGIRPRVFRNTEAMYGNDVAAEAMGMGFRAVIAEGLSHVLEWRSPNYLYSANGSDVRLFLRNYALSDDIAFRFSERKWEGWPLTADKFASWLAGSQGDLINLFMDYETFGEHHWPETGIFEFLHHLPDEVFRHGHLEFATPSDIMKKVKPVGVFDVPYLSSWADVHRDLSAWLENEMQQKAFQSVRGLGPLVRRKRDSSLLDTWRKLQTSDHFYFMCTKWFADGDVHKYFNPYENPYDAYLNFMNVLADLRARVAPKRARPPRS